MGNNCQTNCYDQKELHGGEFNNGDKFAMAEEGINFNEKN